MTKHISVKGLLQEVGFLPFVKGLATRLNLHGWASNTCDGVEILVDGKNGAIETFIASLTLEKPALARIDLMRVVESALYPPLNFEIYESCEAQEACLPVAKDTAICPDCERELFQPKNRRYLYPFISCAYCGPRFSILQDIPYDRPGTTMSDFPMCDHCRAEYENPLDRRFQAQPIACPECGPFVELRETHSQFPTSHPRISSIEIRTSAILKARRLLREGYIVAIKGLVGFDLACDAANPYTLAQLRDRKGRSDMPFAVMAADVAAVVSICDMQKEEQLLLTGREKPIVLLQKKKQTGSLVYKVSELVAPNLDTLGVMLPYTPLHHLLLNQTDPVLGREPVPPILVMTSGNFSGKPIAAENKDALGRLSPLADAFLLHNRHIQIRADDSVVRLDEGKPVFLRRSRGYAPYSVRLPRESRPMLAVGSERKNAFCLARDRYGFLSQYVGNMENAETYEAFEQAVQHLSRIFRLQPEIMAHDLHPNLFTTRYAEHSAIPHIGIQHHHAHIAACMADNGLEDRRVIGLSFDGAGSGTDGAVWGGEVLLASYADFERFAHLEYLPLLGDDFAIPDPWRLAVGYAHSLSIPVDDLPFLQNIDKNALCLLKQQTDRGQTAPLTSSIGVLFDAVASLIGIRQEITYDAQAAIEMEVLAKPFILAASAYPYRIDQTEGGAVLRLREFLSAIVQDVHGREAVGMIGARFHKTVAAFAIEICKRARRATGLNEVVLSGGVWQNQILLRLVRQGLRQAEFTVYFHQQVPTNDGGLALGQAVIANHILARSEPVGERRHINL